MNNFSQQECYKLFKKDSTDFYNIIFCFIEISISRGGGGNPQSIKNW